MLRQAFCKEKIEEYKAIVNALQGKKTNLSQEQCEHARELLKAYEIEYAKALQRDEPPLGDKPPGYSPKNPRVGKCERGAYEIY